MSFVVEIEEQELITGCQQTQSVFKRQAETVYMPSNVVQEAILLSKPQFRDVNALSSFCFFFLILIAMFFNILKIVSIISYYLQINDLY